MKLELPRKIFEREISDIDVGLSDIQLFPEEKIADKQIGYRVYENGDKIEEWIGEEYVVIGVDTCCGDPIIAKIDEEEIPIYTMFEDDWETVEKITYSFEQFEKILKEIDETNLEDRDSINKLLNYIKNEVTEEMYEYWDALIRAGYEFLTDEEL